MAHYIVFGDSITYGEGVKNGYWVQLLRESLSPDDVVFNMGIGGDTTQGLLARFENEIKPRLSEENESCIIIALGINDTALVPPGNYRQNLIRLIKLGRKYTEKIILVGPAPVDQAKVDPIPWTPEISYKSAIVKQYNRAMSDIAVKENVKFVDLFNKLPNGYIQTLADGVHPDATGHRMIFNLVKNVLK